MSASPGEALKADAPPLVSAADPEVEAALDAFLDAPTWQEGIAVLKERTAILLSGAAANALRERIAQLSSSSDGDNRGAQRLERHLRLIDLTRQYGIDEGYIQFQMSIMRSDPRIALLTSLASSQPELEQFVERMLRSVVADPTLLDDPLRLAPLLFPDDADDAELGAFVMQTLATSRESGELSAALADVLTDIAPDVREVLSMDETLGPSPVQIELLKDIYGRLSAVNNPMLNVLTGQLLAEALTHNPLGNALQDAHRRVELRLGAVRALDRERVPRTWAEAQYRLGVDYSSLAHELEETNEWQRATVAQERGIKAYERALEVVTRDADADAWSTITADLAVRYLHRYIGDPANNTERAIELFEAAASVISRADAPGSWAHIQYNLGIAYAERVFEDRTENLERALECFDRALEVFTRDMLLLYDEINLNRAATLERLGRWHEAHEALARARDIERLWAYGGNSQRERATTIAKQAYTDACLRDAWAMLRSGHPDLEDIVVALEEGRAKALRGALALDDVNMAASDPAARARAERFIAARDAWRAAQREAASLPRDLHGMDAAREYERRRKVLSAAFDAFKKARAAIREHDNPDFLREMPSDSSDFTKETRTTSFEEIARAVSEPNDALVYLVAGPDQGFAMLVVRAEDGEPRAERLALPGFTSVWVDKLSLSTLRRKRGPFSQRIYTGGLFLAQAGSALAGLVEGWSTEAEYHAGVDIQRLRLCDLFDVLPDGCGFDLAARSLAARWSDDPAAHDLLYQPLLALSVDQRNVIADAFDKVLLQVEIEGALSTLGEIGLTELAQTLADHRISKLTLIPFDRLGLFPLPSTPVIIDGVQERLGERFEVTIAPNARAAEIAHRRATALDRERRPLLLAAGNPQPLPSRVPPLEWAGAEADTVRRIARETLRFPEEHIRYLAPRASSRERITDALGHAWYAHLAVHGQYQPLDPRASQLLLAGDESTPVAERTLTLGEALDGTVNLSGVRLLLLSACDTALIDVQEAPDEVIGLAAGFLQAGAAGVIASLWAVDDRATYLLMSRFAQLYLDPSRGWSPARALAAAQRWLRCEATNAVLASYDPTQPIPVTDDVLTANEYSAPTSSWQLGQLDALISSTRRGPRHTQKTALNAIHRHSASLALTHAGDLPYADPYFWAGFIVTGC